MSKYIARTIEGKQLPPVADIPVSDISVARLIDDSLLVLYREVKNLLIASSKGKLDAVSARDLRDNLKLLFELKDREKDLLKNLTDEEIQILLDKKKHD